MRSRAEFPEEFLRPEPRARAGEPPRIERSSPPPAPDDDPAASSPEDYLRVVWQRRWFLVVALVLALGGTAAYTYTRKPIFRATAVILIDPEQVKVTDAEGIYDPTRGARGLDSFYNTQQALLSSRRVAEPVWQELGVSQGMGAGAFLNAISVSQITGTRLFRVGFSSPDPTHAARVANALIQSYQRDAQQRSLGLADEGLNRLHQRAKHLRQELERKSAAIESFKQRHDYVLLSETQSLLSTRLDTLSQQLAEARTARIKAEAYISALQEGAVGVGSSQEEPESAGGGSAALGELVSERETLLLDLLPDHPRVRAVERRIESVTRQVAEEVAGRLRAIEAEESALEAEISRQTELLFASNEHRNQFELLVQERATLKQTLGEVNQRIQEVELVSATQEKNTAYVIEPAVPPGGPVWPDPPKNLALAGLLGLLMGVGLCFLVDYLDRSVKSKDEIERLLDTSVLGFVPAVSAPDEEDLPLELTALKKPYSSLGEAFRNVRTGITFAARSRSPQECRRLVVTSAVPHDGKTLVSVNIAVSLAQAGKRVLLINADLRQPRLNSIFGVDAADGEAGFSYLLVGEHPLEDWESVVRRPPELANLAVLPSGPLPLNPADLLQSERTEAFLDAVSDSFDWIILDSPPMVVADAQILLSQPGQQGLFVVRSYRTPKALIQQARQRLRSIGVHLVGAIVNEVDLPRGPSRLGRRYGYGYDYAYGYRYGGGNGNGASVVPNLAPTDSTGGGIA